MIWTILIPLLGILADQLVKWWAAASLKPLGTVALVPGVFHLTYVENTGAAFSMLSDRRWLLLVITVVMVAALIVALCKNLLTGRWGRLGLLLTISGALGNFIDRLVRGYVVDLFDFRLIDFPVFNLADILLDVGVALMALELLVLEPRREKKKREANDGDHRADSRD